MLRLARNARILAQIKGPLAGLRYLRHTLAVAVVRTARDLLAGGLPEPAPEPDLPDFVAPGRRAGRVS